MAQAESYRTVISGSATGMETMTVMSGSAAGGLATSTLIGLETMSSVRHCARVKGEPEVTPAGAAAVPPPQAGNAHYTSGQRTLHERTSTHVSTVYLTPGTRSGACAIGCERPYRSRSQV